MTMKPADCVIVKAIRPGAAEALRNKLDKIGADIDQEQVDPLKNLKRLHYLSVCIIDGTGPLFRNPPAGGADKTVYVVMELSFDGDRSSFLHDLLREWHFGVDQVFSDCPDYPANRSAAQIADWLSAARVRASAFYVGNFGRTRQQIEDEQALLTVVRDEAMQILPDTRSRSDFWEDLRAAIREKHPWHWQLIESTPPRPLTVRWTTPSWWRRKLALLKLVASVIAFLAGLAVAVTGLAVLWQGDPADSPLLTRILIVVALLLAVGSAIYSWWRQAPAQVRGRFRHAKLRRAVWNGVWLVLSVMAFIGLVVALVFFVPYVKIFPWLLATVMAVVFAAIVLITAYWCSDRPAIYLAVFALLVAAAVYLLIFLGIAHWFDPAGLMTGDSGQSGAQPTAGDLISYLRVGLGVLSVFVAGVIIYTVVRLVRGSRKIREREKFDPVSFQPLDREHMQRVREREGQLEQNHLVSVTRIQPGCLGTLKIVFRIVARVHELYMNKGYLAAIPSIHFARWFILRDTRSVAPEHRDDRLVFMTNYDGDFAAYLGDFQGVAGVTMVWSNTEGFPRSYMLAWDGARSEQLFKNFARNSQVKSLIWYAAYPELTVQEIDHATAVREALQRPLEQPVSGFCDRWKRVIRNPITEAEIAQLMRDDLKAR